LGLNFGAGVSQLAPEKTFCYNAAHLISKEIDIGGGN
jgi:hypothetical protein